MAGGRDTFEGAVQKVPDHVDALALRFRVRDVEGENRYDARYEFYVLDADGFEVELREGDLIPHLTPQQTQDLKGVIDALFTKAKSVVGPGA